MIDHVGFEVTDLERCARFYDAVFFALGGRRMVESDHAVAYGINAPVVWSMPWPTVVSLWPTWAATESKL